MVTAEQNTFMALPRPYETQCANYARMADKMNYTEGVSAFSENSELWIRIQNINEKQEEPNALRRRKSSQWSVKLIVPRLQASGNTAV